MIQAIASLEHGSSIGGLKGQQGSKANHGCSAVEELGVGGEGAKGLSLLVLEHGDEGGSDEEQEGDVDEGGLITNLAQHRLARGQLSTQGSNKAHHGQAAVGDLRGSTTKVHHIAQSGSEGGRGRSGLGVARGADNLLRSRGADNFLGGRPEAWTRRGRKGKVSTQLLSQAAIGITSHVSDGL